MVCKKIKIPECVFMKEREERRERRMWVLVLFVFVCFDGLDAFFF